MITSTEDALDIIKKARESAKDESNVESTPSVDETNETSKSDNMNASISEDKVESNDKAVTTTKEDKGSDEPKSEKVDVNKELSNRDYAFIREKQKRKALKDKFNKELGEKDSRIKELESLLDKYKDLTSDNFKKEDGSVNNDAYINWKFKEKEMQNEVEHLKVAKNQSKLQYDLERDRIITERCFQDKELDEYNQLISNNGKAFADAISEYDDKGTFFKYMDTVQEYPIVLKELMSNPNPYLHRIFRSTDPDSIKRNTGVVVDEILDKYYSGKQSQSQVKSAIPIIGKQVTNKQTTVEPQIKDRNYWVQYSMTHRR